MGLRVLTHRPIEELDGTASVLELFQQRHLMDIVAGQTIRPRDDDAVERRLFDRVTEAVKPRSVERGATIPIIAEDMLWTEGLALCVHVGDEASRLLVNRLGQSLPFGRHPDIDRRCSCVTSVCRWCSNRGRRRRGALERRPVQQVLVHLIPSPLPVRRRLELSPDLPVAFHGSPPDEMSHREGRQVCEGGNR